MAKDPYRYFRIEATELSEQMAKGVLELEKGTLSAELVMRLLRLAHTLKGAARVVKQVAIADLAHGLEDTLTPYRDGTRAISREHVDSALAALDAITGHIAKLPLPDHPEIIDGITSAHATALADSIDSSAIRIVRADLIEVDVMLEGLGEIGNELGGVRRNVELLERGRTLAGQVARHPGLSSAKLTSLGEQIHTLLGEVEMSMSAGVLRIDRELRAVRDAAERLRLVPISSIFTALERTARDAAHSTGKQITFDAIGGELRIDGTILDTVQSALIQLVRNAVAHGIETTAQRNAVGKTESNSVGRISVEVERRGHRAWFRCRDDGAGIDLDAVRRALVKKGVPVADIEKLDATALMTVLLEGGISTTAIVTEISGRGIGLDLVREAMLRLGGEIFADSAAGQGTCFALVVPLSLAALDVLMIEHDGYIAALPLDAVRCTLRIAPDQIVHSAQGKFIVYQERQIPFSVLHLGASTAGTQLHTAQTVVVLAGAGNNGELNAVAVERLSGMDLVVLRALPATCPADPLVLGVFLDDEGNPRMVLDPDVLASQRWSELARNTVPAQPGALELPILIIDDSLTTRMLESSILESAGYQVATAVCAEDGWEMAQHARYALFLVDVEMPGMDGFTFVKNAKNDPVLRAIPSILVSSCDAVEDRARGLAAGARAYIVKGEFDQVGFLELISELVQR